MVYRDWDNTYEQLDVLIAQGFNVHQFSEYHFRINDRLDIWPTKRKWRDIMTIIPAQRYDSIVALAHEVFGYQQVTALERSEKCL